MITRDTDSVPTQPLDLVITCVIGLGLAPICLQLLKPDSLLRNSHPRL